PLPAKLSGLLGPGRNYTCSPPESLAGILGRSLLLNPLFLCPVPTDIHSLPTEVGLCTAAIPRWVYKCEEFSYSGCNGNKNNSETKVDCLQACAGQGQTYDNLSRCCYLYREMLTLKSDSSTSHKLCSCSPTLVIRMLKKERNHPAPFTAFLFSGSQSAPGCSKVSNSFKTQLSLQNVLLNLKGPITLPGLY
uniref:BPTI/Kunitz inhibitor domain-containing protein n=1 Tax=Chelonoidis abingdonii TaxID=106734 RepID=A0A8C0J891_CHEAB